jgi:FixJ family two-component response regulator
MSPMPKVFIVDDDAVVRECLGLIIKNAGIQFQSFSSAEDFLQLYTPGEQGCLLLDVNLPGLSGPELQVELQKLNITLPIIFLTAYGDIPMTVSAMKAGAVDFLTKPVPSKLLLERINAALKKDSKAHEITIAKQDFDHRLNKLTFREKEILPFAIAGLPNKEIGQQLGISYRTVEVHRIQILKKTETANFLELAHLFEIFKIPPK